MNDFNDFFKGGKKLVLPNNDKSPTRGGMKTGHIASSRGGKKGGVERDGGKPHKTLIDAKKSFPCIDDTSFRAVEYVAERGAPQQAEETEQE